MTKILKWFEVLEASGRFIVGLFAERYEPIADVNSFTHVDGGNFYIGSVPIVSVELNDGVRVLDTGGTMTIETDEFNLLGYADKVS